MPRRRVSEASPIQVYLATDERTRLDRLAAQLDTTRSDVLRRGLLALERELTDPAAHPALRLIGIVPAERSDAPAYDAAREHDRALAESEESAWVKPRRRKATRRAR